MNTIIADTIAAALLLLAVATIAAGLTPDRDATMQNAFTRRDASLLKSKALPADAGAVTSDPIDLKRINAGNLNSQFLSACEVEIVAPALATGQLPDTKTAVYDLLTSNNSDMSSPTVIGSAVITQTGAGGAGDGTETWRGRLPQDVKRYIAVKCTTNGAADASAAAVTIDMLF